MPELEYWVAVQADSAVRLEIEVKKKGLGWFRLFRKLGTGKQELVQSSPNGASGLDRVTFTIPGDKIKEWTDPPSPDKKKKKLLSFELRGIGAKAAAAPVELAVFQASTLLEAKGEGVVINEDAGEHTPVEIGDLTSAESLVVPFSIRFP